jgi:hypothetical protein
MAGVRPTCDIRPVTGFRAYAAAVLSMNGLHSASSSRTSIAMSLPPSLSAVRGRRRLLFARCALALLVLCPGTLTAQQPPAPTPPPADTAAAKPLTADQLQSLVAPIALYPDDLLAQTLVASTYPLEVVQLQQWLAKHPDLKDKALADSVAKQPWDPSIQSMAAVPEVVKRLAEDIQWTTDLGNAFLAQQPDVMSAVQAMRKKAQDKGALKSNEQQKVETQTVENKTVIVVESANPEVVYVPSYNPTVVYPPPVYPYPPIYYPPYYAGQAFVSFSFGVMMGAAIWGGACCHAGWGGNNIYINNNNNFNQINRGDRNQINTGDRGQGGRGEGNRGQGGRGDSWQHNPSHRGGAPYGDKRTADKFGGSTRGASAGTMDRSGQRGGGAGAGVSNRAAGGAGGAGTRAGGAGVSDRSATGSRGGESVGNRSIPSGSRSGGFSGGSGGYSGGSARASSSRGASSFGGSRGGGASRGGGGGRRR